ncbi:small multi-drug export protein [Crassaminicella thermophila]|uniref:Small multi-drug export protein n=1 Tax=Crassaminicella thermophila TaxID=2599308 RepID=A0A5C0SBK6_CRATE|nr:small multi-drug export protein [Crassaminicella thermophila]QEK11297.1 small multi-drug export protein [Crassaminicella thermophila]
MNQILDFFSKEIMVLLVAAMPVMELRGAIPIGVSLGLSPIHAAILGLLGSMIPVPFLLLLLKPVFEKLRKNPHWRKSIDWITKRTLRKTKQVHKYKSLGLLLFVAVPLPSTGVWTGSIAASLLNIRFKHAFLAIFIGNCIAAFIIMMISHVAVNF